MLAILELLNVYQWYPQLIYSIYIIVQRGVSLTRLRRLGADRLPWCKHICLSIEYIGRGIGIKSYGQYVSSWWCPVWLGYWLYMICTQMSYWDGLWWPALYRLSYTGLYWATPSPGVVEKCVPVGSQSWRLECNMVDYLPQIEAVLMGLGSCEWLDDPCCWP